MGATTFVQVDGVRWALTGDAATVDADGTVVLLGRGSMSINTGGEKVYPEEVEAVVKDYPSVYDAVVVGAPQRPVGRTGRGCGCAPFRRDRDDRRSPGVLPRPARGLQVAARGCVLVDTVVRGPNGKADYRWARERRAHNRRVRPGSCTGSRAPTACSSSTKTMPDISTR